MELLMKRIASFRNESNLDCMKDANLRLMTYYDFPTSSHVSAESLVEAGFFYTGREDRVKCAFCYGTLYSWENGDIAMIEHIKYYAACPFVKGISCGNIPLKQTCELVNSELNTASEEDVSLETAKTIISKQNHEIYVLNIELDCLYSQHEENCKETAEINREIKILKEQLNSLQTKRMTTFAERRREALSKYLEDYRREHPEDTRPFLLHKPIVDGTFITDDIEDEDMIDIPLPLPKN